MKSKTSLLRWAGLCALGLMAFVVLGQAARGAAPAGKATAKGRADLITIKAPDAGKGAKMPPVVFLHDQHTQAVVSSSGDCAKCHDKGKNPAGKESLVFAFKDTGGKTGDALKDAYHKYCMSCHAEAGAAGKKTGPLEADCRGCHNPKPAAKADWHDIGFNKLLHYKHVSATEIKPMGDPSLNCAACHHVYDPAAKKLTWAKGKEDSCRACHSLPEARAAALKGNPTLADEYGKIADRLPLDKAGHQQCVSCHLGLVADKKSGKKSGPVDCAGCHDGKVQAKLDTELTAPKVSQSVPRLMRDQPDAALLRPVAAQNTEVKTAMLSVGFNHKFHEEVTADCRTCHHVKIAACSSCHTVESKKEGGFVSLASAMHSKTSERSCVGCHNSVKKQPSCSGCHAQLPQGMTQNSCAACHSTKVNDGANKEDLKRLAQGAVAQREALRTTTFDQTEIPDQVTIGLLSKEYEPSVLPHRKIVKALMDKQAESRLAGVFHTDKATLCQGCHHNSPPSKTPPKCVSCHSTDMPSAITGRPALKAAYHLQCMTCHENMAQKPAATECNVCHKPRGK